MRGRSGALLVALAAALLFAGQAAAAEVEVQAELGPPVVGIDETAQLTIEVRGEGLGRVRFRPSFELDNLEIAAGPFQAEDIRFVNGNLSRTFRVSWALRPLAAGPARVRSLKVLLRGNVLELAGEEITVREEPTGAAPREEPDDPLSRFFDPTPWRRMLSRRAPAPSVFLRAEVSPERPWVGEQVLYTVYLYTRDDVNAINPRSIPTFQGFWVRDVPLPQSLPTQVVEVDGERYGRVALLRKALFPLRPGLHPIAPTEMELIVRVVERNFFGPAIAHPEEVAVRTQPLRLDVRPLPPPPPQIAEMAPGGANPISLVGHNLSLSAELEPAQVRLGEASTLTLALAGEGHLQGTAAPVIPEPAGLDLLPPQQQGDEVLAGDTLRGSNAWSFAVVPERTGSFELRVPEIPYFDPVTAAYRVAQAPPLRLAVRGRAPLLGERPGQLHGVRASLPPARPAGWTTLLPWAFALPWGIALGVVLVRRRRSAGPAAPWQPTVDRSSAPAAPTRGRSGRRESEARLRERLESAGTERRPRQAAGAIEEAWRTFLAERWAVPVPTPIGRWPQVLAARGNVPDTVLDELARLTEDLHYLRAAPELCAAGPLRDETLERSRRLLRHLR